jgi:hypothetical protein
MKDVNDALGQVTRLEQAIEAVPLTDEEHLTPIDHKYSDQFLVYEVPSSLVTSLMCHSPGRYETMPGRHKGDHFAVSFRLRDEQGQSKHLAQIWKKEGGYWKVVAFHVEPEAHLVDVPDVKAEKGDSSDRSPTAVLEDKSILGPVDELLANWFLGGEIANVMSHFSESAMACVPLLAEEGSDIRSNEYAQTLEGWLAEVAKATGGASSLSDAIQGVQPWHGDLRIFPHPNQDAYVLTSGPDDMAREIHCDHRQAIREGSSIPETSTRGPYYGTAFRIRAAGDHAPVFMLLWARDEARWRVISFNVLTH